MWYMMVVELVVVVVMCEYVCGIWYGVIYMYGGMYIYVCDYGV